MDFPVSANLGLLWPDRPVLDRIDAAGRAGFDAVEFHWPYDEASAAAVAARCRSHGLAVVSTNSLRGDLGRAENGVACLPGREDEFLEGLGAVLDYAEAIGAGAVHVLAGKPGDVPREEAEACLVDNLRRAMALARGRAVLMLEALNPSDTPGYLYSTMAEADGIRARVDDPGLKLMYDAYHAAKVGADMATTFTAHADNIHHVQIAGIPHRDEPDPDDTALRALFRAMSASGYATPVGIEYRPRGDTDAGLHWMARL